MLHGRQTICSISWESHELAWLESDEVVRVSLTG